MEAVLCGIAIVNILGEFVSTLVSTLGSWSPNNVETSKKKDARSTNIYPSHKLRLWEEFIRDGREIASIAQLIECYDKFGGFPEDALDYLKTTVGVDVTLIHDKRRALKTFIKELFKWHAKIHGITVLEAVEKWVAKFNEWGHHANDIINKIHVECQWE